MARPLKLRHRLSILFGLPVATALLSLFWHFAMAQRQLLEARWLAEASRLGDLVSRAVSNNGLERGQTVVLLSTSHHAAINPEAAAHLAGLRVRDAELQARIDTQLQALARIAVSDKLQEAVDRLAQARTTLVAARGGVDACLAARPCPTAAAQWIETIGEEIEALAMVRRAALVSGDGQTLSQGNNPLLKEVAYTMIEHAGRERALVGMVIAERRAFTPVELTAALGHRGVVDEALQKIDRFIEPLHGEPDIAAARAALREEYQVRFDDLQRRVYAAGGGDYPVDAAAWFENATRAIESMIVLAEQMDALALDGIRAAQTRARGEVTLYALAGSAVVIVLLLAIRCFRRRALAPLRRLEQAAATIGAGDLRQPLTGFPQDELGEVAAAFESMRANLLTNIEELRQSRDEAQQLRRVVEQTDDLVLIATPQGIIEYVNAAFEKTTGYARDEVIGQHTRLLKSGRHDAAFYADMWRTISSGQSFHARMIDRRKDGELYFTEETISPLRDEQGVITHHVCTAKDVTERHRLDEQLRHSEKLASIGQLAAGVAHEINNPVGFVHSNLGSLARYFDNLLRVLEYYENRRELIAGTGAAGSAWIAEVEALKAEADYAYLKEDIPALLAESRDGLTRVRHIVQDLRDFSRADTTQTWETVDLRTGLESTLNILHNEIKYRADVVRECAFMPAVECLPSQLNQVFMNLVANAAQAIPEGRRGTICVRCGQSGDTVWVEVADDGEGIPEENLKKIFDPFFTTKPVGKGTGLGLALSHGIVEKHRGRIEVDSQPGVGTRFRISIPLRQQAVASVTEVTEAAVPPAPTLSL